MIELIEYFKNVSLTDGLLMTLVMLKVYEILKERIRIVIHRNVKKLRKALSKITYKS